MFGEFVGYTIAVGGIAYSMLKGNSLKGLAVVLIALAIFGVIHGVN